MERWRMRATALAVIVAAGLSPQAIAVTVTDMRAVATAGQPLDLEIELADLFDTPDKDITITPAPADEHARLGMLRPAWLDQAQFQVVRGPQGQVLARATGPELPVGQRVSFLVQIGWPGHVRLQQVSATVQDAASVPADAAARPLVLPEPTVIPVSPAQPAVAPPAPALPSAAPDGATVVIPADATRPAPPVRRSAVTASVPPAPAAVGGRTLIVQRGDTLSTLAETWDSNLDLAQRQQLIHAENPRAFIDGNINRLRAGARLKLPALDAAPLSSPAVARDWLRKALAGEPASLSQPAQVAASQAADGKGGARAGEDSEVTLTLVAPGHGDKGRAVGEAAGGAGDGQALKTRESLAAAEATRSRLLAERKALAEKLRGLTEQAAGQDARLKVLDERLAALDQQAKAGADRQDVKEAMATAARKQSGGWSLESWIWVAFGLLILLLLLVRRRAEPSADAGTGPAVRPVEEPGPEPEASAPETVAPVPVLVEPEPFVAEPPVMAAAPAPVVEPVFQPAPQAPESWPEQEPDEDDEYDFLTDSEAEAHQTRLDLAQAYIDMNEAQPARELLNMVHEGGTAEQRRQAAELLRSLG